VQEKILTRYRKLLITELRYLKTAQKKSTFVDFDY